MNQPLTTSPQPPMVGARRKRDQKRWKSSGACCCLAILCVLSLAIAHAMRPSKIERIDVVVTKNVTTISNTTSNITRPLDLVVMMDASGSIGVDDWKKEVRFAGQVIEKMGKVFTEKNAGFRAALGQFSTSAYIDVDMTDDNTTRFKHFEKFGADPPSTFSECRVGGQKAWDDMCYDHADYKLCKKEDACIVRRKGFTEIGAALCGPRPKDGKRNVTHCGGGALGSLVGADGPPDNFNGGGVTNITDQCNDPRLNTPLKIVLLFTDGQPQAPKADGCLDAAGIPNPYHCPDVDTPKGAQDAAAAAKLIKAAWWQAAGTPQLFGIYVGKSDVKGKIGQDQLKAISSCCSFNDTVLVDDKVACTNMVENCKYYVYEEDFEALLESVSEIVAKLANFETNLCVVTAHSYKPETTLETQSREIPTTQLLWLLLLLIPCIMALCWGWALKAIDHCIAKPPTDEGSLELIDSGERGDCESPVGGAGAMPGSGASAMNPRKKGAFASGPEDEMMSGGSSATMPRKKGAFSSGEDDVEGGEAGSMSRPKGSHFRPGEEDPSFGAVGASPRPKGSMAGPGADKDPEENDMDLMNPPTMAGQRLPNGKYPWRASPRGIVLNFKKPGTNGIVVHLETPDGTVPLALPPTATMNDLQKQIQEATDLEPDEQKLAFDPAGKQPVTDNSSLSGYNIKDGDDLHLLTPLPDSFSGLDSTGKLPGGGGLDLSASKPGPGGTTVNLVTPKGRVPVNLPANATFKDLQDKVKGLTGIDPSSQKYAFDKAGKEPVTSEPGLTGFDIADGTHLFLKPKLNKNPGPLGLEKSAVIPGPAGLDSTAKLPGDTGVKTGMMIVEVETAKGKTEIELPLTATWDQLQKKLRHATGIEEDPDQWAFDPDGGQPLVNRANRGKHSPLADFDIQDGTQLLLMDPNSLDKSAGATGMKMSSVPHGFLAKNKKGKNPVDEDPNQAVVGADGVLLGGIKMHKLKKQKSNLNSSSNAPASAQPLPTIAGSFENMGSFQDAENVDVHGDSRRDTVYSGRKHGLTDAGFGSFDLGEGYSDGPASFAFIVEPKDLSPELRKFAFNPIPVVMLSSALLPAALYLSGMFDGLLGVAGAAV